MYRLIPLLLLLISSAHAADEPGSLYWIGPDSIKSGFMEVIAQRYQALFGTPVKLESDPGSKGIREVSAGRKDLGGAGRAKLAGNKQERLVRLIPVAWDALTVMVNPDNPVTNISLEQLKGILEGKITRWNELGGIDAPIKLYSSENTDSDAGIALRQRLWNDASKKLAFTATYQNHQELFSILARDPGALAIDSIVIALQSEAKILQLNGVSPEVESLKNGNYPLYRPLYITFVSLRNPRKSEIKGLLKLAYSPEVQQAMRKHGLVPYLDGAKLVSLEKSRRNKKALAAAAKPAKVEQKQEN